MRALRITLCTEGPIELPLAYNELVQGLLYSCWHEHFPKLHDVGYGDLRSFRPLTFSRLTGRCKTDGKRRLVRFDDTLAFELRSPFEELIEQAAIELSRRESVRLGPHKLKVTNLEAADRLLFPQRAIIRLVTPVVAYVTLKDGHTQFYSPEEDEWVRHIQKNARWKMGVLGLEGATELQLTPLADTLRKQVTRFKRTMVTGWMGKVALACDPNMMATLYYLGMGLKNAQGFGMFDILDHPLQTMDALR